jgi:hypothetical protein
MTRGGRHEEDEEETKRTQNQPRCTSFATESGLRSAGEPGTPHAGTWMPLEPGWVVRDNRCKER